MSKWECDIRDNEVKVCNTDAYGDLFFNKDCAQAVMQLTAAHNWEISKLTKELNDYKGITGKLMVELDRR